MRTRFRLSDLIPAEFNVEAVHDAADAIVVVASGRSQEGRCPHCGNASRRVHSRYSRMLADLPCAGRRLELRLTVRRFFCNASNCRRKIFAERFGDNAVRPMARRTVRLDTLIRHLAIAFGGRPAARFADRLGFPVSNDTLLRTVRRHRRRASSALMTGHGVAITDTARSFVILNGERRSHCCLTGKPRPPEPGWPSSHRSRSSHETVVAGMRRPPHRPCRTPIRLPTAGI